MEFFMKNYLFLIALALGPTANAVTEFKSPKTGQGLNSRLTTATNTAAVLIENNLTEAAKYTRTHAQHSAPVIGEDVRFVPVEHDDQAVANGRYIALMDGVVLAKNIANNLPLMSATLTVINAANSNKLNGSGGAKTFSFNEGNLQVLTDARNTVINIGTTATVAGTIRAVINPRIQKNYSEAGLVVFRDLAVADYETKRKLDLSYTVASSYKYNTTSKFNSLASANTTANTAYINALAVLQGNEAGLGDKIVNDSVLLGGLADLKQYIIDRGGKLTSSENVLFNQKIDAINITLNSVKFAVINSYINAYEVAAMPQKIHATDLSNNYSYMLTNGSAVGDSIRTVTSAACWNEIKNWQNQSYSVEVQTKFYCHHPTGSSSSMFRYLNVTDEARKGKVYSRYFSALSSFQQQNFKASCESTDYASISGFVAAKTPMIDIPEEQVKDLREIDFAGLQQGNISVYTLANSAEAAGSKPYRTKTYQGCPYD